MATRTTTIAVQILRKIITRTRCCPTCRWPPNQVLRSTFTWASAMMAPKRRARTTRWCTLPAAIWCSSNSSSSNNNKSCSSINSSQIASSVRIPFSTVRIRIKTNCQTIWKYCHTRCPKSNHRIYSTRHTQPQAVVNSVYPLYITLCSDRKR